MIRLFLLLTSLSILSSCTPKTPQTPFGAPESDPTRETIFIKAPQSGTDYTYHTALVDELVVKQAPMPAGQTQTAIEVLIKGALNDGCTELHEAKQSRSGNQIKIVLGTRRPTNSICTMALRPYRFYLLLEEKLQVGNYTLALNDKTVSFSVK